MENKEIKSTYYEVFTESFVDSNDDGIGDLRGLRSKFSIIAQLGINYCVINDIFAKSGEMTDFYKINSKLGGEDSIKNLCQKAKEFRMKVILDFDFKNLIQNLGEDNFVEELNKIIEFWASQGIRGIRIKNLDYLYEKFATKSMDLIESIKKFCQDKELLLIGEVNNEEEIEKFSSLDMVYLSKANSLIKEKNSFEDFYKLLDRLQGLREANEGYFGLSFENLNSPRLIDKLIEIGEDPSPLAKALTSLLFTMNTIPYLYQGVEIEARSEYELNIADIKDEKIKKSYQDLIDQGFSKDEAEDVIRKTSNFSAKLPIRWDDSALGGFSKVENYYGSMVNLDNNFKKYLKDKDSFFFFLHEMIMLRKRESAFGLGSYEKIFLDDAIYVYKRCYKDKTFIVLVNLTDDIYELDEEISALIDGGEVVSNNNQDFEIELLDAYQALIIQK